MKVAVLGLGYVGTVNAAVLASNDNEVCGVDIDAGKVDSTTLVSETVVNGSLPATSDVGEALGGSSCPSSV